jgi:hypothetical protein
MFWMTVGIFLGVWLDQTFTLPPIQDIINKLSAQYKKAIQKD